MDTLLVVFVGAGGGGFMITLTYTIPCITASRTCKDARTSAGWVTMVNTQPDVPMDDTPGVVSIWVWGDKGDWYPGYGHTPPHSFPVAYKGGF